MTVSSHKTSKSLSAEETSSGTTQLGRAMHGTAGGGILIEGIETFASVGSDTCGKRSENSSTSRGHVIG